MWLAYTAVQLFQQFVVEFAFFVIFFQQLQFVIVIKFFLFFKFFIVFQQFQQQCPSGGARSIHGKRIYAVDRHYQSWSNRGVQKYGV